MKRLVPALVLSLAVSASAAVPSPMQTMARRFLLNFAANRLDAAARDFNEQMKATVTAEVLTNFKQQFDRDLGPFMSVTAVRESSDGTFPIVELTARFEKASALVQVTFDGTGKIGALHFDRVPDHNADLERIAREVFAAFNNRRFDDIGKHFDTKMSVQLPTPALESLYRDVTGVYGKLKSMGEAKYSMQGDLHVVKLSAEYERMPMLFEIVFNNARRVVGWSFRPPK
jgi:Protein of unknown function (DUF3887)